MKIEEYLSTLPQSILSGEEIQIPPDSIREIFRLVDLGKNDTFYHLGCGDGTSLSIARQEFNVKDAVGIDNSKKMIDIAKKKIKEENVTNAKLIEQALGTLLATIAGMLLFGLFVDSGITVSGVATDVWSQFAIGGIRIIIAIFAIFLSFKNSDHSNFLGVKLASHDLCFGYLGLLLSSIFLEGIID